MWWYQKHVVVYVVGDSICSRRYTRYAFQDLNKDLNKVDIILLFRVLIFKKITAVDFIFCSSLFFLAVLFTIDGVFVVHINKAVMIYAIETIDCIIV